MTPRWTICCHLVHDVKGPNRRREIISLTFVALVLSIGTIATAKITSTMDHNKKPLVIDTPTPAYSEQAVDNLVEKEETSVSVVDNPVNDVYNSVETEEHLYTDQQREILAIIIYQEAGADMCSDDTRRKVGSVFLNRVSSELFPDTFEEVATQRKQYGTLYLTGIKWPDRASYSQEAHAVERAYAVAEELLISGGVLPSNVIWQAEFPQGDGIYCYQDGIYFCYSEVNK